VNQPRTKNTSIWKMIVAFRFTVVPLTPFGSGRSRKGALRSTRTLLGGDGVCLHRRQRHDPPFRRRAVP
jgi:hypothetical protein